VGIWIAGEKIGSMYVGGRKVASAYVNGQKVYSSAPAQVPIWDASLYEVIKTQSAIFYRPQGITWANITSSIPDVQTNLLCYPISVPTGNMFFLELRQDYPNQRMRGIVCNNTAMMASGWRTSIDMIPTFSPFATFDSMSYPFIDNENKVVFIVKSGSSNPLTIVKFDVESMSCAFQQYPSPNGLTKSEISNMRWFDSPQGYCSLIYRYGTNELAFVVFDGTQFIVKKTYPYPNDNDFYNPYTILLPNGNLILMKRTPEQIDGTIYGLCVFRKNILDDSDIAWTRNGITNLNWASGQVEQCFLNNNNQIVVSQGNVTDKSNLPMNPILLDFNLGFDGFITTTTNPTTSYKFDSTVQRLCGAGHYGFPSANYPPWLYVWMWNNYTATQYNSGKLDPNDALSWWRKKTNVDATNRIWTIGNGQVYQTYGQGFAQLDYRAFCSPFI